METDLELFEKWQAGDPEAGNTLFQRYFSSICRFFTNKIQGDPDELIQATFLACVRNRDKFRKQSSFRTYLFAIARNQLYDHLRSRQRFVDKHDFSVVSLADLGTTPTGQIARNQNYKLMLHALCTMPLEQQVLLELHYWEDMDVAALSEVFGIEPSATRTRLFRARKLLRERMQGMSDQTLSPHTSVEDLDAWARSVRALAREGDDST